jgi:hypothetical protein
MKIVSRLLPAALVAALLPGVLSAGPVTYSSRALFNADAPGLAVEGFEAGNVADADLVPCSSPLSAASNDACFTPGQILPGMELNNGGVDQGGAEFVLLGAGFFANLSKIVMVNYPDDSLYLDFSSGVQAVGFDLYSVLATDPFDIEVFGAGGSLGTFSANPAFDGAFFGVISDAGPITRIHIASPSSDFEGVDDIAFGTPTPEPGSIVLCGLGALALAIARRRK